MTRRWLLDVNVLIALVDPRHVFHDRAHDWFVTSAEEGWATCPMTENGLLRIVGSPKYPGSPGSPAAVAPSLRSLRAVGDWAFWPDDVSLMDDALVDADALLTSEQLTDSYLLALAVRNGGRLATFDSRLSARAVTGGDTGLVLIP